MANRLAMIAATGGTVRCDGCKHWSRDEETAKQYNTVALGWIDTGAHKCAMATHVQCAETADLMLVEDAESYAAWLYTTPDFGCVLFEAKEAETDDNRK